MEIQKPNLNSYYKYLQEKRVQKGVQRIKK